MKKYLYFTVLTAILAVVVGCSAPCTPEPTPAKEKTLVDYWAFYNAKDPCADGRSCSIEEKRAYTRLGYKAGKSTGLVPRDPRTGLTAIETPIKFHAIGAPYQCPEGTCSAVGGCTTDTYGKGTDTYGKGQSVVATPAAPSLHSQTGYLLTAFDTNLGPRFVLLKADEEFEPGISFAEVSGTYESVAKTIAESNGNIAIFLTAYPLVETEFKQTARLPNDFDVQHIRTIAKKLGKNDQLLFRKWN